MFGIEIKPKESSSVFSYAYDDEKSVLMVKFKSGDVYHYRGVPEELFKEMQKAESAGKYIHEHLKSQYNYDKVD